MNIQKAVTADKVENYNKYDAYFLLIDDNWFLFWKTDDEKTIVRKNGPSSRNPEIPIKDALSGILELFGYFPSLPLI